MRASCPRIRGALVAALCAAGGLSAGASGLRAQAGGHEKPLLTEGLPNVPGKRLTAVVVSYAPGGTSPRHRHAGSVFVYVLSGAIRSENSATGPKRVFKAGEGFFEPPGSAHLVSENASDSEPASLLAVFVADEGAQLTSFDQ